MGLLGEGDKSKLYGDKPIIPEAPKSDQILKDAVEANLGVLPKAQELASRTNIFNQQELDKLIEKALPGGPSQIRSNIAAELRGELPPDVVAQIQRAVASRAASGGFSGTGFSTALGAQDLGLGSLALTERGLNSAQRWLAQSMAPMADVGRSFISVPQQMQVASDQWNRDWTQAKIKAAPDPQVRGSFDTFMGLLGMVLSAYSGGRGYQQTNQSPWQDEGGGGGFGNMTGPSSGYVPSNFNATSQGFNTYQTDPNAGRNFDDEGGGGGGGLGGFGFSMFA